MATAGIATAGIATVFGGSGFIGRYVVKRLAQRGHVVRVAVRDPEAAQFLKTMGTVGQIVLLAASVTDEAAVARSVQGAELVVNLAGILTESGGARFQAIHADGAGRVARLAEAAGVSRLVHISAIGADPATRSHYGASKAAGRQAVRQGFPNATILSPSIVFGPEDDFFNRFAGMARMLPFMPVIAGQTKFQPVYVGDVADAVIAGLTRPDAIGGLYELGGPRVLTMEALMHYIMRESGHERPTIAVPMCLARIQAAILERLPGKLLTRDQLAMLARDNVVASGMPGLTDLGIVPTPLELIVPSYLRRFRPGGRRSAGPGAQAAH
jgi:uncharacterized protein YbjT (DUF2867 family)